MRVSTERVVAFLFVPFPTYFSRELYMVPRWSWRQVVNCLLHISLSLASISHLLTSCCVQSLVSWITERHVSHLGGFLVAAVKHRA